MNQITIGICDDQPEILQALQRLLCEICDEKINGDVKEIIEELRMKEAHHHDEHAYVHE